MTSFHLTPIAFLLGITGCQHPAGTLGECYDGVFTSFCVVNTPPGSTVATGVGIVPAFGTLLSGVGAMILGEATIVSGVEIVGHQP